MSDNYITRCHRRLGAVPVPVGVSGGQDASVRARADRGLWAFNDPRLSGQKNLGSICSSLSPSPTHLSHTTNINPFENKVWERYFYKEEYSFVHWTSSLCLIMFPLLFVYVYVQLYYEYTTPSRVIPMT